MNPTDFTLLTTPFATGYALSQSLTPGRVTVGGTPVYQWSEAKTIPAWEENGQKIHALDFRQAADGSWFGCFASILSNPNEGVVLQLVLGH